MSSLPQVRCGEIAHALLDTFALERERQLGAFTSQRLSDGPGDAAAIGDSENKGAASVEKRHHARVVGSGAL